ncbi:MAG: acetyl-CoA decarbonylase/synthase complex subunit gamma [Eubacteriales bacterium]
MGLSGIQIFKLTPRTNCKECGFPTCMAFSMKVAAGAVAIEKCPHISDEAKEKLSEATAPPMKTVVIGKGDNELKLGGETVLFRHEKTLVNKSLFAVQFCDAMSDEALKAKIENIKKVDYERIGEQMRVELVAVKYDSDKDRYLAIISQLKALNKVFILSCEDVAVAAEAVAMVKDTKPILASANKDNIEAMLQLAKDNGAVLGLNAETIEELYSLVETAEKVGCKELILNPGSKDMAKVFESTIEIRRTAVVGGDRTFGYPSIIFANELSKGDTYLQTALAATYILKYGSIIVLDDITYANALTLFGLRQNIYTDPQKPMRVEPKVYAFSNPTEDSPVLITVDFALTYFVVSGEVERSKVPAWMLIPDAGGLSVLTSWAAGKFSGSVIKQMVKDSGLEERLSKKRLILPGKVAVLKGDVEEELPGWEIIVGPEEAMQIPKFLNELS